MSWRQKATSLRKIAHHGGDRSPDSTVSSQYLLQIRCTERRVQRPGQSKRQELVIEPFQMHILQQSGGGGQKSQVPADSNVCGTRSAGRGRSRVRLALQNRAQQLGICTQTASLIEADHVLLRRAMTPRYPEGDLGVNR